jgi:phosphoribosylanthranilate isomerase
MTAWVKFCGCVSWNDAALSIDAGADAFGMIFAPSARRIAWGAAIDIARRLPESIEPVAVFVDPLNEEVDAVRRLFPNARLQFSGNEMPEFVAVFGDRAIKAIHVDREISPAGLEERCRSYPRATILFDSRSDGRPGGTGAPFAWKRVASIAARRRVVIAGGLAPENVAACLRSVPTVGVDVRSGIETAGQKDAAKMHAFVRAVRKADET